MLQKMSPKTIGLLQAFGLALYVTIFAFAVQSFQMWLKGFGVQINPALSIIMFLLAFIISALACSAIAFGYPITLFFDSKKQEAMRVVLWTGIWLIFFFILFFGIGLSLLQLA